MEKWTYGWSAYWASMGTWIASPVPTFNKNRQQQNKSSGISRTFAWEAEPELTPQPVLPNPWALGTMKDLVSKNKGILYLTA